MEAETAAGEEKTGDTLNTPQIIASLGEVPVLMLTKSWFYSNFLPLINV